MEVDFNKAEQDGLELTSTTGIEYEQKPNSRSGMLPGVGIKLGMLVLLHGSHGMHNVVTAPRDRCPAVPNIHGA